MRKWRHANVPVIEDRSVLSQTVLPKSDRSEVLKLGHDIPAGGHLGINETCIQIMNHFYFPEAIPLKKRYSSKY